MNKVKSLDDLKRIHKEALKKQKAKETSGIKQIIVGMGTIGIASGARAILKTILKYIEEENLSDIIVRQTSNTGLDSWEPIIQVIIGKNPKITYGNVTPDIAIHVIKEHIVNGNIANEYVINT